MGLFEDVSKDMMEFGGGGSDWYPVGTYEVTLDEVRLQDLPETDDGEPWKGYATADGEQLSIQFGNFVPTEGAKDPPGNNKMFLKVLLRDGAMKVMDVAPKDPDYYELGKGKRRLASLADALQIPDTVTPVEFIEGLKNGEYNGSVVGSRWQKWARGNKEGSYPAKFTSITPDVAGLVG